MDQDSSQVKLGNDVVCEVVSVNMQNYKDKIGEQ